MILNSLPLVADARLAALQRWLNVVLPAHHGLAPASSDASFRRYFRVFEGEKSWVVMDAPPEHEDCGPFVAVCGHLAALGLRVPVIRAQDLTQGFLLLDDLGRQTMLEVLTPATASEAYAAAIDALLMMQQAAAPDLPAYDRALLQREMDLFPDWYLARHRGHQLSAVEREAWNRACDSLAEAALAQPRVFVHRDYHSRNLMAGTPPGILDFQDAVIGPLTYDLVSLLRDCYIAWPAGQVSEWLNLYFNRAGAAGILPADYDRDRLQRDFDWMGIQRHLKASGIFARLNHRDGKPGYLNDIPRTLSYITELVPAYPELAVLGDLCRL